LIVAPIGDSSPDGWAIPPTWGRVHGGAMEPNSPAEELPALYRAILDRVAGLERAGERAEAARVRTAATQAYSRAWDEHARAQLQDLLRRADRPGRPQRAPRRTPTSRPTGTVVTQDT